MGACLPEERPPPSRRAYDSGTTSDRAIMKIMFFARARCMAVVLDENPVEKDGSCATDIASHAISSPEFRIGMWLGYTALNWVVID